MHAAMNKHNKPKNKQITMSIETADDIMIASVDATLASWRSAFESSPKKERATGAGTSAPAPTTTNDAKSPPMWKDPDAYQRRLSTFKPTTYFAKPLALSPLVCAAFGWENTGKDILKCRHPQCGATICITFHPSLNEQSRETLCEKYLDLLVTSHTCGCPFRSFASRWSKVTQQKKSGGEKLNKPKCGENVTRESKSEYLMNKVREALGDSKTDYYVPPYLLSLSDDFLRFEDCTGDGSITADLVKEDAMKIRDKLRGSIVGDSKIDVMVPGAVTNFCSDFLTGIDVDDLLHQKDTKMKTPYLLSTFGWSLSEESVGEKTGVIVKCNICQAKTWLTFTSSTSTDEGTLRKRRRKDNLGDAHLKLIGSHRVYCPYVSGFAYGPRQQSVLSGWKMVLSNMSKSAA